MRASMFLPKLGLTANLTGESLTVTESYSVSQGDSCIKGHCSCVAMHYIMQLNLPMFRCNRPLIIFSHFLGTPEWDLLIVKKERTPFSVSSRFSDVGWVNLVKPVL